MIDPLYLPTAQAAPAAPGQDQATPWPAAGMSSSPLVDGRQPRVLVVDDEPPIVELVTGYLEREGWAVKRRVMAFRPGR